MLLDDDHGECQTLLTNYGTLKSNLSILSLLKRPCDHDRLEQAFRSTSPAIIALTIKFAKQEVKMPTG